MRVILVNMPWAAVDKPSLALGILRQAVLREIPDAEVTVVYGNLEYVDWLLLVSTRPGFGWHHQSISDSAEVAAFRLLDQPHTAAALTRKLASAGFAITEEALSGVLARWKALGIVFADNEQFIHLATDAINQELQRWIPPGAARARQ